MVRCATQSQRARRINPGGETATLMPLKVSRGRSGLGDWESVCGGDRQRGGGAAVAGSLGRDRCWMEAVQSTGSDRVRATGLADRETDGANQPPDGPVRSLRHKVSPSYEPSTPRGHRKLVRADCSALPWAPQSGHVTFARRTECLSALHGVRESPARQTSPGRVSHTNH